jgi:predicted metal-dependent HD superfamily phosphohydrolase
MNDNNEAACGKEFLGEKHLERLAARFLELWRKCVRPGMADDGEAAWQDLKNRYQESHRHYHDLSHVYFCLGQLDLVASLLDDRDAAEMSLWYHDVIYEPGAADNETRSAGLFARHTADLFPDEFVANVRGLIMATKHPEIVDEGDARYITDIDLSSFALSWDGFRRDNENLREEQSDLADASYYAGKKGFLIGLSRRPRIFRTDFFHDLYEARARSNIQRYLAELHSRRDDAPPF